MNSLTVHCNEEGCRFASDLEMKLAVHTRRNGIQSVTSVVNHNKGSE